MQFEVIRKSHKKEIIIGVIVFVTIAIVLIVHQSFAKYQTTKNMKIAEGTINYKIPDFNIIAMYKNDGAGDIEITTMPESGYTINESKSYCNLNGSKDNNAKLYTNENGNHVISKLSKGDKCYLYFNKKVSAGETVLSNVTIKSGIPNFSTVSTTDEGVYKTQDETGKDTYYFRGAVTNNYIKFGKHSHDLYFGYYNSTSEYYRMYDSLSKCQNSTNGYKTNCKIGIKAGTDMYWRIIRINSNESIRIIYDGGTPRENGKILGLEESVFNTDSRDNAYVGFKYTIGNAHGLETNSTILTNLETWYSDNLSVYSNSLDYIEGFCGDRTPSTSNTTINNSGGTGSTKTYYGAYVRLMSDSPSLTCQTEDFYTVNGSSKGNKTLRYPIGLISADEAAMAGGRMKEGNKKYYVYTGQNYWTISPLSYYEYSVPARAVDILSGGDINYSGSEYVHDARGLRPVINLRPDITLTGTGTMNDPYVVQ